MYITDETGRHEVTSWKLDDTAEDDSAADAPPAIIPGGVGGAAHSHVVLVVDCSGSMRKDDVPGHTSRTSAVYECLAREFVEPQIKLTSTAGPSAGASAGPSSSSSSSSASGSRGRGGVSSSSKHGGGGGSLVVPGDAVVTIIEMRDASKVILKRHPINKKLSEFLRARAKSRATSHGNYLPALDTTLAVLRETAADDSQLLLMFLSDGGRPRPFHSSRSHTR